MAVAGNRQFLNQIFSLLPGMKDVSFSTYGFIPAACVLIFALFPIATLMVRRGLSAIQPELIEVGLLSGNSWQVWRRLILPLIFPSVVASAGLIFVLAFIEYGVPSLLQYNVYIGAVRAFAAALPIILITVSLLTLSQFRLKNSPLQSRSQPIVLNTQSWPSSIRIVLLLCVVIWGIASIVPLIVLIVRGGHPGLFWNTFLYNFNEIRLTVIVTAAAAVITTVIAVPLAMSLTRRMSRLWWLIFALPLAIPAPLVGIAMIYIWNNPVLEWAYGSWIILVLVQAARFLPFALFTASSGVRNIDPVLIEASQLPDTGFRRRLIKVTLPLLTPTVVMTWLVSFIFALGELGASLLVAPPGQSTLPITIYNLLHYGATDTVSVMSLIIVITAGVACAVALLIYNRMLRKKT
jgi:iron(III) transport system permease protein